MMALTGMGGRKNPVGKTARNVPSTKSSSSRVPVTSLGTGVTRSPQAPQGIKSTAPRPAASRGGGGGAVAPMMDTAPAAPAAPAMSDDDFLSTDSAYQLQLAALARALSDNNTDLDARLSGYETNYNDSLRQLGWDGTGKAWNREDQNTASGRAFSNLLQDFASRGLLQSSGYATANDDLGRSLNDQLSGINTARQTFKDDVGRQRTAFNNENTGAQQQARADALARRAAGISLA